MFTTNFTPWPKYSDEELQAVSDVLRSGKVNYWTGSHCRHFEEEFAKWVGVRHAVAMANGTVALEAAFRALGLGQGDEVIVTPRTFIASVSSIVSVGATPVFVDVDIDTQNISATTIRPAITSHTRAILCVHLAGMPCDMGQIMALAEEYGIYVVEDCAQAHGARYKGRMVGGIGHVAAWSFCQDKIISTGGEGGMVTTNDDNLWEKMWSYKDHGKSFAALSKQHNLSEFRWIHESFGSNLRMTEMQAVIGRIQLKKMPEWQALRKRNAQLIYDIGEKFPSSLRIPVIPEYAEHAWYKCYLFIRPEGLKDGWDRGRIIREINKLGVPCYSGICPEVYREKAFEGEVFRPVRRLPIARELGEQSVMFLVHPTLSDDDMKKACDAIAVVMQDATRDAHL